jgi:[ribosomal protein S5]-alanine N-acetyltransferase
MFSLITPRLELRDFRPTDFADVHAYASDPLVTQYMSFGPNTEEETRDFLSRSAANAAVEPRREYALAIVERASGQVIGSCGLHPADLTGRHFEFGYCLRRDRWGLGIGSEVVIALMGFVFNELGAHRLVARVYRGNHRSIALLRRQGFREEGLLREATLVRGVWTDTYLFGRLASDAETIPEKEPASP